MITGGGMITGAITTSSITLVVTTGIIAPAENISPGTTTIDSGGIALTGGIRRLTGVDTLISDLTVIPVLSGLIGVGTAIGSIGTDTEGREGMAETTTGRFTCPLEGRQPARWLECPTGRKEPTEIELTDLCVSQDRNCPRIGSTKLLTRTNESRCLLRTSRPRKVLLASRASPGCPNPRALDTRSLVLRNLVCLNAGRLTRSKLTATGPNPKSLRDPVNQSGSLPIPPDRRKELKRLDLNQTEVPEHVRQRKTVGYRLLIRHRVHSGRWREK